MLRVEGLGRRFGAGDTLVTALEDVSLSLADGVFAAVVGPSGSGKSTLLSCLGTLDKPTAGAVRIGGQDVTALSDRELTQYRRARIGFVFQAYNLIPNLSAIENVMLPMEFAGVPAPERRKRAQELLTQVGLDGAKQGRKPARLSGGEQQRVAVARAMANDPCLILADEPTGNLDSETGAVIVDLLKGLARSNGTTVVAVTHDSDIAESADVTFRLRDGRLVESFSSVAARADAAYRAWAHEDGDFDAFARALRDLVAAAPTDRKLSPAKFRSRYPSAEGRPDFEGVLAGIGD